MTIAKTATKSAAAKAPAKPQAARKPRIVRAAAPASATGQAAAPTPSQELNLEQAQRAGKMLWERSANSSPAAPKQDYKDDERVMFLFSKEFHILQRAMEFRMSPLVEDNVSPGNFIRHTDPGEALQTMDQCRAIFMALDNDEVSTDDFYSFMQSRMSAACARKNYGQGQVIQRALQYLEEVSARGKHSSMVADIMKKAFQRFAASHQRHAEVTPVMYGRHRFNSGGNSDFHRLKMVFEGDYNWTHTKFDEDEVRAVATMIADFLVLVMAWGRTWYAAKVDFLSKVGAVNLTAPNCPLSPIHDSVTPVFYVGKGIPGFAAARRVLNDMFYCVDMEFSAQVFGAGLAERDVLRVLENGYINYGLVAERAMRGANNVGAYNRSQGRIYSESDVSNVLTFARTMLAGGMDKSSY